MHIGWFTKFIESPQSSQRPFSQWPHLVWRLAILNWYFRISGLCYSNPQNEILCYKSNKIRIGNLYTKNDKPLMKEIRELKEYSIFMNRMTQYCQDVSSSQFDLLLLLIMIYFLQPHGLQHTRLPCPSLFPGVCLNSCPLSRWCYLTISSSATLFSFCLQSFPASGSFLMSQFFTLVGQILELQLQHQSFQWIFRVYFL